MIFVFFICFLLKLAILLPLEVHPQAETYLTRGIIVHRIALLEIVLRHTVCSELVGKAPVLRRRSQPAGVVGQSGTLVNFDNVLAIKDVNHPKVNIQVQAGDRERLVGLQIKSIGPRAVYGN